MNSLLNLNFSKALTELLPKLFPDAFIIVVTVTILGFLLAMVLGLLMALAKFTKLKALNFILNLFIDVVRGTPLLVQLVYVYYVVPLLLAIIASLLGFNVSMSTFNLSAVQAGIIGFGINYGTYLSEVIRSAILAIDDGQREAALALGFSPKMAMLRIVIPQAFKNSIPVFGNYLIMLVKDTSLLAYIAAQELLLVTKAYTAQTFLTIESYTILAGVYLIIYIPLSLGIKFIERKLSVSRR